MLHIQLVTCCRFYKSKIKSLNCFYNSKEHLNFHQERYQSLNQSNQSFKHCVEDRSATKGDCMYYLERYTRGRPRDLVQSCFHMNADRGFETAKRLLQEHFGNETRITAVYMDKVLNWPAIKVENVPALQDYALFLRGCNYAMSDLHDMRELNMSANLKIVIWKLPYKLRESFRNMACQGSSEPHTELQRHGAVCGTTSQTFVGSHFWRYSSDCQGIAHQRGCLAN